MGRTHLTAGCLMGTRPRLGMPSFCCRRPAAQGTCTRRPRDGVHVPPAFPRVAAGPPSPQQTGTAGYCGRASLAQTPATGKRAQVLERARTGSEGRAHGAKLLWGAWALCPAGYLVIRWDSTKCPELRGGTAGSAAGPCYLPPPSPSRDGLPCWPQLSLPRPLSAHLVPLAVPLQ